VFRWPLLGTEACDAVGGALRPKWREWPSRGIRRVLSELVAFGMLLAALFALLPSRLVTQEEFRPRASGLHLRFQRIDMVR
jgi:hypothetical protein